MSRPVNRAQSPAGSRAPSFRRLASAKGGVNAGEGAATVGEAKQLGAIPADGLASRALDRPVRPQGLHFVAVEEAFVVSLKAKVLRQQHLATVAAATTSPALPAADAAAAADASHATPGQLPPPHAEAPDVSNALGAAAAIQAAPAGPKEGTGTAAAASDGAASVKDASAGNEASSSAAAAHGRASRQSSTVVQRSGPGPSFLGWDLAGEEEDLGSEDWGDCLPCSESQARLWSTQSTAGSVATAASSAADGECFPWVEDPTVRAALGLGLDPLKLPLLGGPGSSSGNPKGAIKALRLALAHPAPAPSSEGIARRGSGSHLRLTKCMLAKQRQKAGAAAAQAGGVHSRVATIDALLAAMKRRLSAVHAAMQAEVREAAPAAEGQPAASSDDAPASAPASSRGRPTHREEQAQQAIALHMREAAAAALPLFRA